MQLDLERTRANVKAASTEDLIDRATIYRDGMEPEALAIIDEELRARGVGAEAIAAVEERRRQGAIWDANALPVKCQKCPRPAVMRCWGWHCVWGVVPLFPRRFAYCEEHRPEKVV
jgi:hypothetical protein